MMKVVGKRAWPVAALMVGIFMETAAAVDWYHSGADYAPIPADLETQLSASNRLALGADHAVALTPGGVPFAWGNDAHGKTTLPDAATTGISRAAVGMNHTLLLGTDGVVTAFGLNASLQTSVPTDLGSASAVAAGDFHSLALVGRKVVAWGYSRYGQTIVPAAAQTGVTAIAAGSNHSVALTAEGKVIAWGWNIYGQAAVPAAALEDVVAIAAGGEHTAALKADGSVLVWGRNDAGQRDVPEAALSGVSAIASGEKHLLALKDDGSVVAWGSDSDGQTEIPAAIDSPVQRIEAGGNASYFLTGALDLTVEDSEGAGLISGESVLESVPTKVGNSGSIKFVVRNEGSLPINGLAVTVSTGTSGFSSPEGVPTSLVSGGTTTVTVPFAPTTSGDKSATVTISAEDVLNSPFTVSLGGTALSSEEDTDGDGFNDWLEYVLRDLGFDYESDQTSQAATLREAMAEVGIYFETDVGGLDLAAPVLARDSETGKFSMLLDFQQSSDLATFADFPLEASMVTLDEDGNLQIDFDSGDDKAFYRIKLD
ncbi:hypothetical protein [Haloferula sargassicola]|uniref:Uncharacterized protein n=1 Tax=Haloferula sargassicola TaxID=490096 RepID=A0ABP9UNB9_9BACT